MVVFNVVYKSGRRGNSWILDVGAKMEEKKKDEYVLAEIVDNEEGITAENTETEVSGSVNFREEVEASEIVKRE